MACQTKPSHTEVYSILFDRTDQLLASPNKQELENFTAIKNPDKTVVIRYAEISDVDFNKVIQLVRPGKKSGLLANQVQEKRKQDVFTTKFKALFTKKDSVIPVRHSSIFQSVLNELYYLETLQNKATKTLIVYSDLMENTLGGVSFYRSRDLQFLYRNPDKIATQFLNQIDPSCLPKGSVTSIHIVYIPKDNADNNRYKQLQKVYRAIFSELDIPISFSANLTNASFEQ